MVQVKTHCHTEKQGFGHMCNIAMAGKSQSWGTLSC